MAACLIISALIGLVLIVRGWALAEGATLRAVAVFFAAAGRAVFAAADRTAVLVLVLRALVTFLVTTRLVAGLAAALTVRFGAAFAVLAAVRRVEVAAFLAAGLARAGAFFLATTAVLAATFFLATGLEAAVALDFALRAVACLDSLALVEDEAAFFLGALPFQGGVAPFSLDVAWVAAAI